MIKTIPEVPAVEGLMDKNRSAAQDNGTAGMESLVSLPIVLKIAGPVGAVSDLES